MHAVGDFIDAVAACQTAEAVGALMLNEAGRHGYASAICSTTLHSEPEQRRLHFFNTTRAWSDYVRQSKVLARSPVNAIARTEHRPFWYRAAKQRRDVAKQRLEVFREAEAFGWTEGLVVPLHGRAGKMGTMSLATLERDVDLSAEAEQRMASTSYLAFQRCEDLSPGPRPATDTLTKRELECLRWVAGGKTDFEIGMILGISQTTVKFHIDRARERLGAATRAQATAQIALAGLL